MDIKERKEIFRLMNREEMLEHLDAQADRLELQEQVHDQSEILIHQLETQIQQLCEYMELNGVEAPEYIKEKFRVQ